MEGAYGTASLAVSRLISSSEEESQYPESFGLLRSVLRRRPVVLGFVMSILAEKLQGTELVRESWYAVTVDVLESCLFEHAFIRSCQY